MLIFFWSAKCYLQSLIISKFCENNFEIFLNSFYGQTWLLNAVVYNTLLLNGLFNLKLLAQIMLHQ